VQFCLLKFLSVETNDRLNSLFGRLRVVVDMRTLRCNISAYIGKLKNMLVNKKYSLKNRG